MQYHIKLYLTALLIAGLCSSAPHMMHGQTPGLLTQSASIDSAIENNFNIRVARRQIALAANNASKELTGYLPTVTGTLGGNYELGGSTQQFSNGNENIVESAASINASAGINVNYNIFDPQRKYTLEQLNERLNLTDLQLRSTIELNILQVLRAYFEVGRLTLNADVLRETIATSTRRLDEANINFEYGRGTRLDMLNAQVDLERDSINMLNTLQALNNAKHNLNALMGRDVETAVEVDTSISYLDDLNWDSLLISGMSNNVDILIAKKNLNIIDYDYTLAGISRYPVISSTVSYNYSFQDNPEDAFITSFTSNGLGVGINLNWNIYDGGARRVREQNALINKDIQKLQLQDIELQLERDLKNAWQSYQNARIVLNTERNNVRTSAANMTRTEEEFRIGQVNSVAFRQAQLNLINAKFNYAAARFNAKLLEYEVLQLSGLLLK